MCDGDESFIIFEFMTKTLLNNVVGLIICVNQNSLEMSKIAGSPIALPIAEVAKLKSINKCNTYFYKLAYLRQE